MNAGFYGPATPPRVRGSKDWARGITPTANVSLINPQNITDGDDSTVQNAMSSATPQIFTIDLGAPRYITHMRLLDGMPNDGLTDGYLAYSADNSAWTVVQTWLNRTTAPLLVTCNAQARYWRLYCTRIAPSHGVAIFTWSLFG